MSRLRDDDVRRLVAHLHRQMPDETLVEAYEEILRSDEAAEFLRHPEFLNFFPLLTETIDAGGVRWELRIIPHARLRSVQRGISVPTITSLFRRFVEFSNQQAVPIIGNYSVTGRPSPRKRKVTIRFDVNQVSQSAGSAHVVTVVVGTTRTDSEENNVEV